MTCRFVLAALVLWALSCVSGFAHEVRPGYLELTERAENRYDVVWKQPLLSGMRLKLEPVFPDGCAKGEAHVVSLTETAVVESWQLACGATVRNRTVSIDGLQPTLTDVFLRVVFSDGETFATVLRPAVPGATVTAAQGVAVSAYLGLGVRHILFGLDHILFVVGLLFVCRGVGLLLKTITAFTVAHSLSLGLSAFGVIEVPQTPVDAVVALSILFLATELARTKGAQGTSLTFRYPWAVAFAFGLVHGIGFASALKTVGLPKGDALGALFLFNVGVELGQIAIVAAVLLQIALSRNLIARLPMAARLAPVYAMGVVSAYWLIERLARMI